MSVVKLNLFFNTCWIPVFINGVGEIYLNLPFVHLWVFLICINIYLGYCFVPWELPVSLEFYYRQSYPPSPDRLLTRLIDRWDWFQISQLVEDVRRLQSSIGKLQENTAKEIGRLEEELHDKRQHIMRLEARLDAQRDYEDVKRQLRWVTAGIRGRRISIISICHVDRSFQCRITRYPFPGTNGQKFFDPGKSIKLTF